MILTLKLFYELKEQNEILKLENQRNKTWIARQSGMISDYEKEIEKLKEMILIADQALRFINSQAKNRYASEALVQMAKLESK